MNRPSDLVRLLRPHEWTKNGFVFTGLLFGHGWRDIALVYQVILAAVAFSLISSGVYIVNDLADRESDRRHPAKKSRPLALGTVSASVAVALAIAMSLVGLGLGAIVSSWVFLLLSIYIIINLGYSFGLKRIVIVDVFIIAAGFMLRILAGTVGVGIPPSRWLLLCGLMGTLLLGFAKRRAELNAQSGERGVHREVLGSYAPVFLDTMIAITASNAIVSYSLYTLSRDTIRLHGTANLMYTVPFIVYGIFRYLYLLYHCGVGVDPARELARDPHMLLAGSAWLLVTLWLIL
jgi:4-hydroxybenzoate polyprenyltransferase